jgi:hypothetical protein
MSRQRVIARALSKFLDDRTLAILDRLGNRRLDTSRNVLGSECRADLRDPRDYL